jgi:hypothetical protein
MKILATFLFGLLLAASSWAANPTFGQHGMAMFGGRDGIYAAHLPMFHAPHDYQVLLRLRMEDSTIDRLVKARLDGKTVLWTIAPEKFELDRLAPRAAQPLKSFRADLVLGHFEQGGKTQYKNVAVVVEEVLLFRRLSAEPRRSEQSRYFQVGSGTQRFLVKEIDSRPDFDHIVAFRAGSGTSQASITVPKKALDQTPAGALAAALKLPPDAVGGTVYYYLDDLR